MDLFNRHEDALKAMADFAEHACEQLLRIAEIFLMLIAEQRLQSDTSESLFEKAMTLSKALRELTASFLAVHI